MGAPSPAKTGPTKTAASETAPPKGMAGPIPGPGPGTVGAAKTGCATRTDSDHRNSVAMCRDSGNAVAGTTKTASTGAASGPSIVAASTADAGLAETAAIAGRVSAFVAATGRGTFMPATRSGAPGGVIAASGRGASTGTFRSCRVTVFSVRIRSGRCTTSTKAVPIGTGPWVGPCATPMSGSGMVFAAASVVLSASLGTSTAAKAGAMLGGDTPAAGPNPTRPATPGTETAAAPAPASGTGSTGICRSGNAATGVTSIRPPPSGTTCAPSIAWSSTKGARSSPNGSNSATKSAASLAPSTAASSTGA